jgi:hypothetical protein
MCMADSPVSIQALSLSEPSTPSWFGDNKKGALRPLQWLRGLGAILSAQRATLREER